MSSIVTSIFLVGFVTFSLLQSTLYSQGTSGYQNAFAEHNEPDFTDSLTVNPNKHHYRPGENVTITGSVWIRLLAELDDNENLVAIVVRDNKRVIVASEEARISDSGEYSTIFPLPRDARLGAYTVDATIQFTADSSDRPKDSDTANLHGSVKFVVVDPSSYSVEVDGKESNIFIASNSTVTDFSYSKEQNIVSFTVKGETGTRGVTWITLPKELLGEDIIVSIDGRDIPEDSHDVIVTSDSKNEITVEINYLHSEHTIQLRGRPAVPTSPDSALQPGNTILESPDAPLVTTTGSFFVVAIVTAVALFLSINYLVRQKQMKKGGQNTWRRLGFTTSSGREKVVEFYCMSCGVEHELNECPSCGSKLKKARF